MLVEELTKQLQEVKDFCKNEKERREAAEALSKRSKVELAKAVQERQENAAIQEGIAKNLEEKIVQLEELNRGLEERSKGELAKLQKELEAMEVQSTQMKEEFRAAEDKEKI